MNPHYPLTVIAPEKGGRIDIYKRTPQGNIHLVISSCASTGEPHPGNEALLLLSNDEARALIQSIQLQIESA